MKKVVDKARETPEAQPKAGVFPVQTPSTSGVLAEKSDGICLALRGRVSDCLWRTV